MLVKVKMYGQRHGKRILVADDDDLLVELLRFKLEQQGHEVAVASDGTSALEIVQRSRPDVIILDLMIPALDGFEFLRRLKERPQMANIPVLVLSARKREQDIVRSLTLGARDYLTKPFIPDELLLRIDNLFARQAA